MDAPGKEQEQVEEVRALRRRMKEFGRGTVKHQRVEEQLKQYQFMVQSAHDAIFFKDLKSRYIIANNKALEAFGLPRQQVIGKNDYEILPNKEEARKNIEDDSLVFRTSKPTEIIKHMTGTDGKKRWFEAIKVPQFDDKGKIIGLVGIARDITKHKQTEQQLRESEERFRMLADLLPQTVFELDIEGNYTYANRHGFDSFGYTQEDIDKGLNVLQLFIPEEAQRIKQNIAKKLRGEEFQDHEYTALRKDGRTFPVFIYSSPIIREGKQVGLRGIVLDITESKRAEEALRESEEKFRLTFENAKDAIFWADTETGIIIECNKAAEALLEKKKKEIIGKHQTTIHPPQKRKYYTNLLEEHIARKGAFDNEAEVITKSGKIKPVHITASVTLVGEKPIIQEIFRDITERKKTEEALLKAHNELEIRVQERSAELRQSEERFRLAAESTSDLIYEWDMATDRLDWFGDIDGALGFQSGEFPKTLKAWAKMIHPDDQPRLADSMKRHRKSAEPIQEEYRILRKDGTWRCWADYSVPVVDSQGRPRRRIGACVDITDRKKAENALKESEEHYRIFAAYQRVISELRNFYMVDATFEQMIQKTLDLIINQFGYYMAWYAELIEQEKVILPKLWAGKYEKYLDGLRLEYESDEKDAKCAMSLAILSKKPFGYADLEHDKDFEKWRAFALQYGYRSNQAMPLIIDGKCKSAFLIYSTRPFAFSEKSVEYLKGIVDELAVIIGNITERKQAQDALQKAHDQLEMRVVERTKELAKINEELKIEITERNKAEKTLLEHQERLRSLASELSLTEERERRRIATELHDRVSQYLALSMLKLDNLRKSVSSGVFAGQLGEIGSLLEKVVQETRFLIFDLCSPLLYKFGFERTIEEWLIQQVQQRHGIKCEFVDDGQSKPLEENVRVTLFQATRELLINIIKHAQARLVKVSIRRKGDKIETVVEDDGAGFDLSETQSVAYKGGAFGLFSIKERLTYLGGDIRVESEPGHGTRVTLVAPLKTENEGAGENLYEH